MTANDTLSRRRSQASGQVLSPPSPKPVPTRCGHDVADTNPEVVAERLKALEELLGGPLPAIYDHQPDDRNDCSLRRHVQVREELGMPL